MHPEPTGPWVSDKRHRFPAEIIGHCVWLYHRFGLSLRDVQELLAARGVAVTREPVRQWCRTFGPADAQALRRRRPRPGDTWHTDEVQPKMNGRRSWLWRAVAQEGMGLDVLVQERRHRTPAESVLRRVAEGWGTRPRVVSTEKLAGSPPAIRRVLPGVEPRRPRRLHHRAETAHRPPRRRDRARQRFTSPEQAQRFLACVEPIRGHFCPRRHRLRAAHSRAALATGFAVWRQAAGLPADARAQSTGGALQPALPRAVHRGRTATRTSAS